MPDLALAFLWHQHQPYYPDDVTGDNPMPWVRLHGVKDYYGMALHLLEFPEMRCTINLVPSLLVQIERYTERGGTDRPLEVARRPAGDLSEGDALYLLDHFFMANHEHMIRPLPRYYRTAATAGAGQEHRARGAAPLQRARPARPASAVQPRVDSSARLRTRSGTGGAAGQGPPLHRSRQTGGARQAPRHPAADHPAAPAARRAWPGRADDDAVLPSDPAAVVRQEAGPRGDARRQAAALQRRLSRRRDRAGAAGGRRTTRRSSASRRAACGPRRAASASR